MEASGKLDSDLSLDAIMRRWPATTRVFIRHGMFCVGCPIATFHTIAEACEASGVDRTRFESELLDAIQGGAQASSSSQA